MKSAVFVLFAALASCAGPGLGRLPPVVIEMYDEAKPGGVIEIEAERDGRIIEIETEIEISALPRGVREAAEREVPGGRITGAEVENVGGVEGFEVRKRVRGRDYELVYTRRGLLLEKEVPLDRDEAPPGVIEAAALAVPGGRLKSVERIERGAQELYHVKLLRDNTTYKVELTPGGVVRRTVREQRAELEIPVR